MTDTQTVVVVPRDHVFQICRPGALSATCRYVLLDGGLSSVQCVKSDPALRPNCDARVESGQMMAAGDNCSGWPDFKPTLAAAVVMREAGPIGLLGADG